MLVALALLWAPAEQILVQVDAHDFVGREKAVLDALPQRVGVDRARRSSRCWRRRLVSLGVAVRPIWVAPTKYSRTSRQAESSAALPRWHSSTTIRSKKSRRELLVDVLRSSSVPDDGLVERQIDLEGLVDVCDW